MISKPEFFVHIIESPSANDLLDGCTEGRSLGEIFTLAKIPHCYNLATNKETFKYALLNRLIEAYNYYKKYPIRHLSLHGNQEGVGLTDKTFLSWAELQKLIAPLTNDMQGGLLICMSSCFGASGCRMAMYEGEDQPFWALVGNKSEVSWKDAAIAYATFYHLWFKGFPVEECVNRMKLASDNFYFDLLSGHKVKSDWAEYMKNLRQEHLSQFYKW